MNESVAISGTKYTVKGTIKNRVDSKGIPGLTVQVYDKDRITKDDFLDSTTTNANGVFVATFDLSHFKELFLDRKPDLYFIVIDVDKVLLNTQNDPIMNADPDTPPITLWVDDFDSTEPGRGVVPALGWVGGFVDTNKNFPYPTRDLSSLPMLDNMDNIKLLERQQKVLWPEFSWQTVPGEESSRAYQMFAPDISRLGYTNDGRVYSIICPQQGTCSSSIGCMNVEVTVTGNRGWVNEANKQLAADMEVVGKIWFTPSAHQNPIVKRLWEKFASSNLPFPSDKANAIEVITYDPGNRPETIFPLNYGQTTAFAIPDFAKHEEESWNVAHLGVEIGDPKPIDPTIEGHKIVDAFNKVIMAIFNLGSGNMLKNNNVLTWNVWFIAPQLVNQREWAAHAVKWRNSINADHGSPMGEGTSPKYYDGSPFKAIRSMLKEGVSEEEKMLLDFEKEHFG